MNSHASQLEDPHHEQPVLVEGEPLESAAAAIVMLHGRGASAQDILPLSREVGMPGVAYIAPQAVGGTWYPYSFLMPVEQNEPHLSSALATVGHVMTMLADAGIPAENTVLLGFSQGACLAAEFVARNARRYGGLIVFSGGLIGPDGTTRDYPGSLDGTPVFIGCSDIDSHVPERRVRETGEVLARLGGDVDLRIFSNMGHTINRDELMAVQHLVSSVASPVTPADEQPV